MRAHLIGAERPARRALTVRAAPQRCQGNPDGAAWQMEQRATKLTWSKVKFGEREADGQRRPMLGGRLLLRARANVDYSSASKAFVAWRECLHQHSLRGAAAHRAAWPNFHPVSSARPPLQTDPEALGRKPGSVAVVWLVIWTRRVGSHIMDGMAASTPAANLRPIDCGAGLAGRALSASTPTPASKPWGRPRWWWLRPAGWV